MKILIWGTGYYAQKIIKNGINSEIIGFVETEKSKNCYFEHPVFGIDEIPQEFDYIIVANIYSDDIYETCIKLKLKMEKIVFIKRGKREEIKFNADKKLRIVLGDRNYTKYAIEFGRMENTFWEDDREKYSLMNKRKSFEIKDEYLYPIITDKYEVNSGMTEYFWQDLWAAKHIIADGIKEHYDIGSRVDGFIAHLLAANIKVNMIDIRPFPGAAENLFTVVDDATMLRNIENSSIKSLSAMCSLEHFGLGRYGDPIDPEACFKCFAQIQKKMVKGGKLYISVPIGKERLEFNAHRIFYADTIISCFDKLTLLEYSVIANNVIDYNEDIHKYDSMDKGYVTGLFLFKKMCTL